MKSVKPKLYYDEKGNPKGYKVGIFKGVYGTCPFCGKSYTEEDVKNGTVNFEHIFPRFAVKKAIDEQKVFSRIESEFMVGVHKDCNDRCSLELERQISRIIANVNKPHVHLMQADVIALFNFCIKVNIFLRYLFMWEDNKEPFCYDTEKIFLTENLELLRGLNFYKNFVIRIRNVDSSAGLFWGLHESVYGELGKYSSNIVINNIEISFFDDYAAEMYRATDLGVSPIIGTNNYGTDDSLFIKLIDNHFNWCKTKFWDGWPNYIPIDKRGIPWTLGKSGMVSNIYQNYIPTLPNVDQLGLPPNYLVRQKKLSLMSQKRFEENKSFGSFDKGIVFYRNGQFYIVDNDGMIQNISNIPKDTTIPTICFENEPIQHLPNISQTRVVGDFRLYKVDVTSLEGAPYFVQGDVMLHDANNLTSLKGGPIYVGKSFYCGWGVPLTTLEGAPRKIVGDFVTVSFQLKSLNCGETEIGGEFRFSSETLESLDGLPKATRYFTGGKIFRTEEELREWFKQYKSEQKIKRLQDGTKVVTALAQKDKTKPSKPQHEM